MAARVIVTLGVCAALIVHLSLVAGGHAHVKLPTVLVAICVRNKAHTLPYFLTLLQRLDYPKDRLALWIRSDHNEDNTLEILRKWVSSVSYTYHSVSAKLVDSPPHRMADEEGPAHWTPQRFTHMINLREEALTTAREMWADYVWFLDSDVFVTNVAALQLLVAKEHAVVAPMLGSDGLYSNFWCGMTDDYYYQRTDDYKPILRRQRTGCFHVPMVHSSVLVDLRQRHTDNLTFVARKVAGYSGPHDDIITFALAANNSGIPLYVCNDVTYGYVMVPLEQDDGLHVDYTQLTNIKLEVLVENPPLPVSVLLAEYVTYPPRDTMGFDAIYMINLVRRPERRLRMELCFKELGIHATIIDAVDGRELNTSWLAQEDIRMMPEYSDPYHKRPMTMGEVGCFLSHYNIWKEMMVHGYNTAMVLEDDVRFEPFFRNKVTHIMAEVNALHLSWDLVYLGRKRNQEADEPWVPGSRYLVRPGYSYWTLGYLVSRQGAFKLLQGRPLERLLPVDEYLPILADSHPQDTWKAHFVTRDLMVLSVAPLLVYPTHYTGEDGYISDTTYSEVIEGDVASAPAGDNGASADSLSALGTPDGSDIGTSDNGGASGAVRDRVDL